jgi:hypothetical protein
MNDISTPVHPISSLQFLSFRVDISIAKHWHNDGQQPVPYAKGSSEFEILMCHGSCLQFTFRNLLREMELLLEMTLPIAYRTSFEVVGWSNELSLYNYLEPRTQTDCGTDWTI